MKNNTFKKYPNWSSDCYYQRELERIWNLYEHEADLKEKPVSAEEVK